MLDKFLAVISMATFVSFLGVVAVFVNEPDLWAVLVIVVMMGIYDFFLTARGDNRESKRDGS